MKIFCALLVTIVTIAAVSAGEQVNWLPQQSAGQGTAAPDNAVAEQHRQDNLNALTQEVINKVLKVISIEVFQNLFTIVISNCNIHYVGSVIQSVITVLWSAVQVPSVLNSLGGYQVFVELIIKFSQPGVELLRIIIESLDYGLPRAALEIKDFLYSLVLKLLVAVVGPPENLLSEIQQVLQLLVKFNLDFLGETYENIDNFCNTLNGLCPEVDYSSCDFPVYHSH